MVNPNDKKSKITHWVSLLNDRNTAAYFDSFGIEYITQEVSNKSKINRLLTIGLEYKIMILLCVDFIVSLS